MIKGGADLEVKIKPWSVLYHPVCRQNDLIMAFSTRSQRASLASVVRSGDVSLPPSLFARCYPGAKFSLNSFTVH